MSENSLQTTEIYNNIYKLFVTEENDKELLKENFDNSKLRDLISVLILANGLTLGVELDTQSMIKITKQEIKTEKYSEQDKLLFSGIEIEKGGMYFEFNKNTESFNIIKEMSEGFKDEKELFYIHFSNVISLIKTCFEITYEVGFTQNDNSYSKFMIKVMLPIINQLVYSAIAINKTSPDLLNNIINKIINSNFNNIIREKIQQKLTNASQQRQLVANIVKFEDFFDEDLITICEDWSNLNEEEKQEKLIKVIEIARNTKNIKVIDRIIRQKRFMGNTEVKEKLLCNIIRLIDEENETEFGNKLIKKIFGFYKEFALDVIKNLKNEENKKELLKYIINKTSSIFVSGPRFSHDTEIFNVCVLNTIKSLKDEKNKIELLKYIMENECKDFELVAVQPELYNDFILEIIKNLKNEENKTELLKLIKSKSSRTDSIFRFKFVTKTTSFYDKILAILDNVNKEQELDNYENINNEFPNDNKGLGFN